MKRLTFISLFVSSLVLSCFFSACDTICYWEVEHHTIINKTGQDIAFESDLFEAITIAKGDSVNFEREGSPMQKCQWGGNPRVVISNDSIIMLYGEVDSNWQYDCLVTQLADHEWRFTYIIDNRWLTDAWVEYQTGEHPSCTKHFWYD